MTVCRTRKTGVLSAQDCGNASAKNGEKDPIVVKIPKEIDLTVQYHSSAPTAKDGVPDSEVGWDCDYTAGSPIVFEMMHSCDSKECATTPNHKKMVSGSVHCSKLGFASYFTNIICNHEGEKLLPSANQCRIRFYRDNKTTPPKKIIAQTLKEAGLAVFERGNSDNRLSDGTEATTNAIRED